MNEMMIDVESFGTDHDSVLVSVGWTVFNEKDGIIRRGYEVVNVASEILAGSEIDPETVKWWNTQEKEARDAFLTGGKPIDVVMLDLAANFTGNGCQTIWANGDDFDIGNISFKMRRAGFEPPWQFWQWRDLRTVKDVARRMRWEDVVRNETEVAHNALDDAVYQTEQLLSILEGEYGNVQSM